MLIQNYCCQSGFGYMRCNKSTILVLAALLHQIHRFWVNWLSKRSKCFGLLLTHGLCGSSFLSVRWGIGVLLSKKCHEPNLLEPLRLLKRKRKKENFQSFWNTDWRASPHFCFSSLLFQIQEFNVSRTVWAVRLYSLRPWCASCELLNPEMYRCTVWAGAECNYWKYCAVSVQI